jgi:hypothetical protein
MTEKETNKITVMIELSFEKGDVVKHVISGEKGRVIDYRFYGGANSIHYCVSFHASHTDWFTDLEIELHERKFLGIGF